MKKTKASKHRKQGNIFQFIREEKNSPVCMGCGILEQSQLFMKSSVFFMRPGSPLEVLAVYSMYDFCQVTLQLLLSRSSYFSFKGFHSISLRNSDASYLADLLYYCVSLSQHYSSVRYHCTLFHWFRHSRKRSVFRRNHQTLVKLD